MASDGLLDGMHAVVHGVSSRPERNGTCVRVGKRVRAQTDEERLETTDEFTGVEAAYRPTNLRAAPPLSPLANNLWRLCTTPFLVSIASSNDLIRVDALVAAPPEEALDLFLDKWDTRGAADKDDLIDVTSFFPCVTERFFARLEASLDKACDQLLEL